MAFLLGPPHDDTEAIIGYTFSFSLPLPLFLLQSKMLVNLPCLLPPLPPLWRDNSELEVHCFLFLGETLVSLSSSSSSATNPRLIPNDTTQGHRCAHFSSSDLAAGEIYTLFHRLLQIALLLKILVETFRDLTWKFKVNKIFFWCIEIKFLNSKEWLCER